MTLILESGHPCFLDLTTNSLPTAHRTERTGATNGAWRLPGVDDTPVQAAKGSLLCRSNPTGHIILPSSRWGSGAPTRP